MGGEGRALWLGWARGPSAALGQTWEVATWANTLEKLPLGKNPLGKYLISIRWPAMLIADC